MSTPSLNLSVKRWSMFAFAVNFFQSVSMIMDSFCMNDALIMKLVLSVEFWMDRLWLWMNPVL